MPPIEDRITNLLSLLTVTEKLGLMNEYQPPVDRLGIKAWTTFVEGVHGVGWSGDPATPSSSASTNVLYLTGTQFPQAYGLAESWDPEVMRTVGATTGYEARVWNAAKPPNAQGRGVGLVVRAPLVDLGRDPRWGRTEEGLRRGSVPDRRARKRVHRRPARRRIPSTCRPRRR